MIQKRNTFLAAMAVMFLSSFGALSNAKADAGPAEGFYVGAFIGHGTGIVQPTVTVIDADSGGAAGTTGQTFDTDRGGLGLNGIQGGGWLGWGLKTADDLYFGAEVHFAGSDEKIKLTSNLDLAADNNSAFREATAKRNWVSGGAVRVGYYVNKDTLFALSGGIAVSQFDVTYGSSEETYYAGGPQVGGSLETNLSKIDPNLGLRFEFAYTNYLTAEINGQNEADGTAGTNNDSELTGSDLIPSMQIGSPLVLKAPPTGLATIEISIRNQCNYSSIQ
jgi:hypothetical protein